MGGAHVFPGGTVDPEDRAPSLWFRARGHEPASAARVLGESDGETAMALFCAAVRETFEEAGVLLAELDDAARMPEARRQLLEGEAFERVLEGLGANPALDRLVPHSRWITPEVEPRRYDARFFVASVSAGQWAEHDRKETTAGVWLAPSIALEQERAGAIQLPPPTMRTLEALAAHDSVDAVLRDAARRPPPVVQPVFREMDDGSLVLCLPGDPEHPVSERALPGPTRMVLEDGRWWSREAPP